MKSAASWRRTNFDLHNLLGFYTGVLIWWNSRKPKRGATRDVDRESAA